MNKHWMLATLLLGLRVAPVHAASPSSEQPSPDTSTPVPDSATSQPVPAESAASARAGGEDTGPPSLFSSVGHIGGYGGPSVMYSHIAGEDGVLVGGEGALLIDHRLALGGAGYGWTRQMHGPADVDGVPRNLELGYGGFLLRYSILTGSLVYGSLGALIGAGAVSLHRDAGGDEDLEDSRDDTADTFFAFEPQLSLQINLVRWMRLGLQGGYRITSGLSRLGYTEQDINGLTLGGTLQFGSL